MADQNFMRYLQGAGQGFNPYGAGAKQYGTRGAPNVGPTNKPEAYNERDMRAKARKNAMLRRLKAQQRGKFMSSDYLTPQGKGPYNG
jgi:hypothetical protein